MEEEIKNNIILYKHPLLECPECNKSFSGSDKLFYHVENFHRSILFSEKGNCPNCESKNILFMCEGKSGSISIQTGKMDGEEHSIYICDRCKNLFKTKK